MNNNVFCKLDDYLAFALFVSSFFGVLSEFHYASYYMCVDSKVFILGLAPVIIDLECVTTMAAALRYLKKTQFVRGNR